MRDKHPFHQWIDLAQPRLGSEVVFATDDFFADKARLIDPKPPIWIDDKYDDHGKWMDGWESRRKRTPGHDYCIVRLGLPGLIHGFNVDTSHFTGNFPPAASIEACISKQAVPDDDANWVTVLPRTDLQGNAHHYEAAEPHNLAFTHLRLNVFPDGGVARLRVYGEIRRDWQTVDSSEVIDLFALEHGGRALLCNDEHFGSMHNLNVAGRGINMGDGWETARRRVPGNDWVILALGCPGQISEVEIDTAHFKGNYPDRACLQAAFYETVDGVDLEQASEQWETLLPEVKLEMDRIHLFTEELADIGPVSHIKLHIFPDGGVSRLRLRGKPHVS